MTKIINFGILQNKTTEDKKRETLKSRVYKPLHTRNEQKKLSKRTQKSRVEKEAKLQKQAGELTPSQIIKQREKLVRQKAITHRIAKEQLEITDKDSEERNSLIRRMNCKSTYIHDETGIHGSRCEQRTCIICSNIRTMKKINKYLPIIENWPEIWLVTLTTKNVKEDQLNPTLNRINKALRVMQNNYRSVNKKEYLKYIRGTEITVNEDANEYHPHTHNLTSSYKEALFMQDNWLKEFPEAKIFAQDIRQADKNTLTEVFKYIAKPYKKEPRLLNEKTITLKVNPRHLNIIDHATKNVRLTSDAGIKRYCKEIEFDLKAHAENEKNYKLKADYRENQTIPKGVWNWKEEENMYVKYYDEPQNSSTNICNYNFEDTYKIHIEKENTPAPQTGPDNSQDPQNTNSDKSDLIKQKEQQSWNNTLNMFREFNTEIYNKPADMEDNELYQSDEIRQYKETINELCNELEKAFEDDKYSNDIYPYSVKSDQYHEEDEFEELYILPGKTWTKEEIEQYQEDKRKAYNDMPEEFRNFEK